ncbi:uncharacterized protein LOC122266738 [Penaeus japonicus]|uniref:uncharacterized protein LOC122266738 n=1 Tax=Penaeus japonicus TaxID=27405 RepID=UPI001C70F331|nr:uncharacterized protein LOC122266738 [Penaeus japonicus]
MLCDGEARGSHRRQVIESCTLRVEMGIQRAVIILVVLAVMISLATSFRLFPRNFGPNIEKGLGLTYPGRRGFAYNIKPDVTDIIGIWAPDHDHRFWHDYNIYGFTSTG